MLVSEDLVRRPSPLSKIIPVLVILGLVGYLAYSLSAGMEGTSFYEIGIAMALMVYIITFIDITLGIAILIACIGLSPEMEVGGVTNLRLEDFIVPALILAWIMRSSHQREAFAPNPIRAPMLFFLGASMLSSCMGAALGQVKLQETLLLIAKSIEYYFMYLIILNNVKTERELQALATLSILVAVASALLGVGQSVDTNRLHGRPARRRTSSVGTWYSTSPFWSGSTFMSRPRVSDWRS